MTNAIDRNIHPPVPGFIWLPSHPIEGGLVLVNVEAIVYVAAEADDVSTVILLDDTEVLTSLSVVEVATQIREAMKP